MPPPLPSRFAFWSLLAIAPVLVVSGCRHSQPAEGDAKEVAATPTKVQSEAKQSPAIPARCTPAWNRAIDRRLGITDSSGHGPDIGSSEWMEAVSRKSGVFDAAGHGPDLGSDEWCRAVDFKVFGRR